MSRVANLSQDLSQYEHASLVRQSVERLCQSFPDLTPHLDSHEAADGTRTDLVCLLGTVPIFYKGHRYNIPVGFWLLETYPYTRPEVSVKPTDTMEVKPGKYVDYHGIVKNIPYLDQWRYPQSDLHGLAHSLVTAFGIETPVVGKDPVAVARAEIRRREHFQQQFQNDSNFRAAFAKYAHPVMTKEDICDALQVFPELKPTINRLSEPGGDSDLVCLQGTLPVVYQGVSETGGHYNIPVCIYLKQSHPDEEPRIVIKPTAAMTIRECQHVDRTGRVQLPLRKWEYPKTSLTSLIRALVDVFSQERPLMTKPVDVGDMYSQPKHRHLSDQFGSLHLGASVDASPRHLSTHNPYASASGVHNASQIWVNPQDSRWGAGGPTQVSASPLPVPVSCTDTPFKLNSLLKPYQHAAKTKSDILRALKTYPTLEPVPDIYYFEDGTRKELLTLQGTVPVRFEGSRYHIPVCIWLRENHPNGAPMVYVAPTASMQIVTGTHVDPSGKVHVPYIQDWHREFSNLYGLIQVLAHAFSEKPPVAAKTNPSTHIQGSSSKPRLGQTTSPVSRQAQMSTTASPQRISEQGRSTSVERELRELRERNQCKICMDDEVELAFQPCGHLVACRGCAPSLDRCPMCRAVITGTLQVYLS